MEILGVKIDAVTKEEAISKIASFLDEPHQHFVTTPNPEIILYARNNPQYREILNRADLALADGIGLLMVSKLPERVSGTDMIPEIARLAREKCLGLALVGGFDQNTTEKAAAKIRQWGARVVYASYGVPKDKWNDVAFHDKIIAEIRAANPDIVLAGFGHPKQEAWIDRSRAALPGVRLLLGCGGALDFIAGAVRRAPAWMRKSGLEWFWRLILEPKRFKRIVNAVIVFPLTVLHDRLWKK